MTEDEYERLRSASLASGARSLSEFAREAVLRAAARQARGDRSGRQSPSLVRRVAELEAMLRNLLGGEQGLREPGPGPDGSRPK
ncbi:MAG: hypothetical protein NZM33_07390 [Bryobacteraceae bacterium]|nr:hypothetical protein [Bryobacteraceae bacterium]